MNQNYIQAINFACIIYLTYLTLGISRDNVLNLKTKNEDSSDIVDKIKEVLKDELKDIRNSQSQSHTDRLIENSDDVSTVKKGKSSKVDNEDVMNWIEELKGKGMKHFSQNDEDGAIEAIFDKIGTKDKIYVEFGVEDCTECNTRYLRSVKKTFLTLLKL